MTLVDLCWCGAPESMCGGGDHPDYRPRIPTPPPVQQGCICPPTSEQTCRSPICPRKPMPSGALAGGQP